MKNQFLSLHLDFVGFTTSLLCAVHCALLPVLLSILPLAGIEFLRNPWLEVSIISLSFIVASVALIRGYYRHFKKSPLLIVTAGFLLISLGHLFESSWIGVLVLTLGALIIALAHYYNWKYLKISNNFYVAVPMNKPLDQINDKDKRAA